MIYRDEDGLLVEDTSLVSNQHKFRFNPPKAESHSDSMHPIQEPDNSQKILALGGNVAFGYVVSNSPVKTRLGSPFYREIFVTGTWFRGVKHPVKDVPAMLYDEAITHCSLDDLNQLYLTATLDAKTLRKGTPAWRMFDLSSGEQVFKQNSSVQTGNGFKKLDIPERGLSLVYDVKGDRVVVWYKDGDEYSKVFDGTFTEYETKQTAQIQQLQALKDDYRMRVEAYKNEVTTAAVKVLQDDYIKSCAFMMDDAAKQVWINQAIEQAKAKIEAKGGYVA